jgi:hypothetical protein
MIEVLGVKNSNKIVPLKDDHKPMDPVSENMAIMTGKPVKAFIYQDHQAHLAVHMAAIQDPKLASIMGQNPQAQALMAAAQAHVMEHVAFEYRAQLEAQLGATLPPPPDTENDSGYLPPEQEVQLSQLVALAAQQLLQKNQSEAQQQQNQQQQQDPIIQMQQQELQLKGQELQLKQQELQLKAQTQQAEQARKDKELLVDATAKNDELTLRKAELDSKNHLEGIRIGGDAAKHKATQRVTAAKMAMDVAMHNDDMRVKGTQLGVDIARDKANNKLQHKKSIRDSVHKHANLEHQARQSDADRAHQLEMNQQQQPPPEETE